MDPEDHLRIMRECREMAHGDIARYLRCVDERVKEVIVGEG